ncbi:MAG: glycine cleavage system aminomethyltransferase GcvT [Saprospiraceae bacterium]|nr:glycine cleavage system aminomethyltransferase GcvT [Saprospiraceae bacterium]
MKNTPLTTIHEALGAKMAGFAGYNMPIVYTSISEEHHAVRSNAGVFDVSHMGEFMVRGPESLDFLQKVTSNDVSQLKIGQAQYSCLPNKDGGIVDDLLVYRMPEEHTYMLVVNASNIDKDWQWLLDNVDHEVQLENISEKTGLLAVQGPHATELLQPLTNIDLKDIGFYHFKIGSFAGIDNTIISATGYTGSGGFELYVREDKLPRLWEKLMEGGDIQPAGLGARDTLRLEMGYCLYGNDITDKTSPIEAGLGWITKLDKGDFNSSDIFKKQKEDGVSRRLAGFTTEKRVPRQGYGIENEDGEVIGEVTSGTQSPSLGHPIGMGYVKKPYDKKGTRIFITRGSKRFEAEVRRLPFYKPTT